MALLALAGVGPFAFTAGVGASAALRRATSPRHLIHAMPTVHDARIPLGPDGDCVLPVAVAVTCVGVGEPMTYGGGPIEPDAAIYIVYWGWNGNDPSGEAAYQQAFFNGLGGSAWAGTQSQYCDSTADPAGLTCAAGATHVGNPPGLLKGTWTDNTDAIPASPTDADIQAEAVRAAAHFGNTSAGANASTEYIVDTPHGNSTSGFGTQWCAYHGSAGSSYGALSYTDFPYIPDAGASCGENFVNAGAAGLLDGVSIVAGHEFAESETDPVPPSGWTDLAGAETGDKCAWIQVGPGASADLTLGTGTFAVQSLWSNSANGGLGGCSLG